MSFEHGVRLKVAYDGTEFCGWQAQPNDRTVQGVVEDALTAMGLAHTRVRGCSRTDSGVHAEGQIAAFACNREIKPRGWVLALNGLLPDDVAIVEAAPCAPRYDPRFDSVKKLYRYRISVGMSRDPLSRRQAWQVTPRFGRKDIDSRTRRRIVGDFLDLERMNRVARGLEGKHNFHAFRSVRDTRDNTIRTLFDVRVLPEFGGEAHALAIEVVGDAFMKNMVRILVGTLVEVGRHKMTPEFALGLLDGGKRPDAGPTAPANGLTLVHIWLGRQVASQESPS
ncbi:MAG: tRNA pseudouridine(38-40) synthase TruA [Myxococcota bacterium]